MDYTRNEDKQYLTDSGKPNRYNSIEVTEIDADTTEPVTLVEMKNYLRLIGFEDEGDSPTTELSNFDFDDALISELITDARESLEDYTGLSFVEKTLSAKVYSGAGYLKLSQGPVKSITSFKDADDVLIDPANYTMIGDVIKDSFDEYWTIIYVTGFDPLPKKYKIAIMMWVAASYDHRGDEILSEDIYKQAKRKAGNNQSWVV